MEICKLLNADTYYNAIGGQELYDKSIFENENINLYFVQSNITQYPQYGEEFISRLSIIDVLMFNSNEEINNMLKNFQLV